MSEKSKIFDNKQLIHVGCEVVVLAGLTFYFSSKNRKLKNHIEELAQRQEEQEDRIQKLEEMVKNISGLLKTTVLPHMGSRNSVPKRARSLAQRSSAQRVSAQRVSAQRVSAQRVPVQRSSQRVSAERDRLPSERDRLQGAHSETPYFDEEVEEVGDVEDNESDLDEEIREELNELDEDNLKN